MNIHLGIDIAKNHFDVVVHQDQCHEQFPMTRAGIQKCIKRFQKRQVALAVMEATGGYELELFAELVAAGIPVAVVNPRRIRDFARADGRLAKTDKIDAQIIAKFAAVMQPPPSEQSDEITRKIKALVTRQRQIIDTITAEKNRRETAFDKEVRESLDTVIDFLEREQKSIEEQIRQAIEQTPELRHVTEILESAPSIAEKTSATLVSKVPEIGSLSAKRISALVGLAPINRDSGQMRGKRTTGGGRKSVRTALYMPTLVAIRHNPVIRDFYQRLIADGKPKMVAIVACMRKLLTILNAMVAKNQKWIDFST